jgi:hypothetical protein
LSEVKLYPGSEKGPLPDDDPDNYSRWFIENQPKSIYGGKVGNFKDLGVKTKNIAVARDTAEHTEYLNPSSYYVENDEFYPLERFKGVPE